MRGQSLSGEEVSVSLGYALGLPTGQTPPTVRPKRNTTRKKQNRVDSQDKNPWDVKGKEPKRSQRPARRISRNA
jgi:hypothetical protein